MVHEIWFHIEGGTDTKIAVNEETDPDFDDLKGELKLKMPLTFSEIDASNIVIRNPHTNEIINNMTKLRTLLDCSLPFNVDRPPGNAC